MPETAVETVPEAPIVQGDVQNTGSQDPFVLDENSLASLSLEQRASLDPIIETWRKKATDEIQSREKKASEKYKPLEEKAQALDKLTNYQPFVQWWSAQQKQAQTSVQTPGQSETIQNTDPKDVATQAEWQEAIWDASNGNSTRLQTLQARMMAMWATPFVQEFREKQQNLETKLEMKDLFESHPDAKELDKIGIDPTTKEGVSLLEMGLDWAEKNQKPLEQGYMLAKRWADALRSGAKAEAMGLVSGKKQDVTAGPSTSTASGTVIEVADADELLRRSLESQLSGQKDVRYVIRSRGK